MTLAHLNADGSAGVEALCLLIAVTEQIQPSFVPLEASPGTKNPQFENRHFSQ